MSDALPIKDVLNMLEDTALVLWRSLGPGQKVDLDRWNPELTCFLRELERHVDASGRPNHWAPARRVKTRPADVP